MDNRIEAVKKLSKKCNQICEFVDMAKHVINIEHEHEDTFYYELMTGLSRLLPEMEEIVNEQIK